VTAAWIGAGIVAAVAAIGRPLLFASIDQTVAAARGVRSGCSESASSQSPATPPSFAVTAVAAAGYTTALVAARHRPCGRTPPPGTATFPPGHVSRHRVFRRSTGWPVTSAMTSGTVTAPR